MPLTAKGKKIKKAMEGKYGKERGERVFYASENKGSIKGVAKKAKGGEPWKKDNPKPKSKRKSLSTSQKSRAKAMAKKGGRPYPNLVDNMRAAKSRK